MVESGGSRQIGIANPYRTKIRALNAFRERLLELHEAGEKVVVIIDEGQMLEHRLDLLQELRILLNFCVGDSFLLSVILSLSRRCSADPTPESNKMCGEPMAPLLKITSPASTVNRSPPLSTSTPTARLPSKMTLRVTQFGRIVRFKRWRAGFK